MTISKAVARAWTDPDFKEKLVNDPHAALADVGVDVPDGASVKVVENSADTVHLVLPVMPSSEDTLDMDELENIAGGTFVTIIC